MSGISSSSNVPPPPPPNRLQNKGPGARIKLVKCKFCTNNKIPMDAKSMIDHIKQKHPHVFKKCNQCEKSFFSSEGLSSHKERVHWGNLTSSRGQPGSSSGSHNRGSQSTPPPIPSPHQLTSGHAQPGSSSGHGNHGSSGHGNSGRSSHAGPPPASGGSSSLRRQGSHHARVSETPPPIPTPHRQSHGNRSSQSSLDNLLEAANQAYKRDFASKKPK